MVITFPYYMTLLLISTHTTKIYIFGIASKNITTPKGGGFLSCIKVIESDRYNNHIAERLLKDVNYIFIKDVDNVYHRTKYQNVLVEDVYTPYIAIWEVDIIAYPELMIKAVKQLRTDKAEVAYPYNGKVLDTSMLLRDYYAVNQDITFLHRNIDLMNILYKRVDLVGGAIFYKREAYLNGGKDDERFYGWGNEDFERHIRWKTLGYRIFRADGHMYHLSHTRGINSKYKSLYNSLYSSYLILSANCLPDKNLLFDKVVNLDKR